MRLLSVAGMEMLNKGIDITDGENYWEYMLKRPIKSELPRHFVALLLINFFPLGITGFPDYLDGMGMLTGTAQVLRIHYGIYTFISIIQDSLLL